MNRRKFLEKSALAGAGLVASGTLTDSLFADHPEPVFKISLAQWSLHRTLKSGKIDNLDFVQIASQEFDINLIQKEIKDMGEENLKDLFDKLHALPDDELQDTLRTYPTIREIWHKHFAEWVFGKES